MQKNLPAILALSWIVLLAGAAGSASAASAYGYAPASDYNQIRKEMVDRYGQAIPTQWGEAVAGVKRKIRTEEKVIALTLDACGSATGMNLDQELIDFLEREQVPATLFVNARWIERNRAAFDRLAANPLFEIANHGLLHKPASVTGRPAYGISGTRNVGELVDEIELSNRQLAELTGKGARFFRSGTAHYDDVAVKVAGDLGMEVAGYSILGDAGATFSSDQVKRAILSAGPGDIVLLHMNHPGSGTAAGIMEAVPQLKKRGYSFVRLSDVELQ